MKRYSKGPWIAEVEVNKHGGWQAATQEVTISAGSVIISTYSTECAEYPDDETNEANARLMASAPAMDLALSLIACGAARIEPARGEPGQNGVRAFCFDGSRYILDGDWNALLEVIGWDKAIAAVENAQGAQG